jgi:hypothetical protein
MNQPARKRPITATSGITDDRGVVHTAIVPPAAGWENRPWCTCGWRQSTPDGPILGNHLQEIQNGDSA